MSQMILCEHPKKIFNRAVFTWLQKNRYTGIVAFPSKTPITTSDANVLKHCYRHLHDTHLIDTITGEAIELEMEVPCGHCACCRERKSSDISTMIEFETQVHDKRPLMIRLSYEKAPLLGLHYRDVQLFLKRLNIYLTRNGLKTCRFAVCGEYGTTSTRRPHYHLIIWDLRQHYTLKLKEKIPFFNGFTTKLTDTIDLNNLYAIDALVRHIWKKGQTDTRETYGKTLGRYLGKYISKSSNAPDGCNKPFFRHSILLGTEFALTHAKYIEDNKDNIKLEYLDKFTGKVSPFVMATRYMDKIFPTISKRIPIEVRRAVVQYYRGLSSLLANEDTHYIAEKYMEIFDSYRIILPDFYSHSNGTLSLVDATHLLDYSLAILSDYKNNDYTDAEYLSDRRRLYYDAVFRNNPVTSDSISRTIRKRIKYEKTQESKNLH